MDDIFFNSGLDHPIVFNLNMHKFEKQGYFPFSLSFNKAESYWDFLVGRLNVFIFIEFKTIENIAKRNGFNVQRSNRIDFALKFVNENNSLPVSELEISEHYFNRTFMEFVSLDWLIQDLFNQFDKLKKEVDKKND
jgi:hypothetical protein